MQQPLHDRRAPAAPIPALRLDARRLALLAGLAVATLALLVRAGGGRATFAALTGLDARLLLLAAAVHYAGFALRGHRWQMLLAALDHRLSYLYTTGVLLSGWFVSALLPARAGDALRVAALRMPPSTQPAVPVADSLGTIVLERTLDILAILLLSAGFGIGVLGARLPGWLVGAYAAALLLLAGVGAVVLWTPALLARLAAWSARPLWQQGIGFARQVADSLRRLPRRPGLAARVVGASLLIWLCDALLLWLVVASLGQALSLPVAGFVALTVDIFAAVPLTPGGMGQIESAYAALLALLAQPGIHIPAAVLAVRAISYWSFLLISGVAALATGLGRWVAPPAALPTQDLPQDLPQE
jgi:uncharacterized membrane protein YbhN (UPF0104 family)